MERVGFQQRAAALLIDLGLIVIAVHVFLAADLIQNEWGRSNMFGLISGGGAVLIILVYGLLEIFWQGTVGKRIMGIMIACDDGAHASRGGLAKRWAIKQSPVFFASLATLLFMLADPWVAGFHGVASDGMRVFGFIDAGLGLVMGIFILIGCMKVRGPTRQAFHDAVAGTAVYRRVDVLAPAGFRPLMRQEVIAVEETPPPIPQQVGAER